MITVKVKGTTNRFWLAAIIGLQLIQLRFLFINHQKQKTVMTDLTQLEAEVAESNSVADSAVALIQGLSQQIKDAGTDPVKLAALTSQLDASNQKLADAVIANTPAASDAGSGSGDGSGTGG